VVKSLNGFACGPVVPGSYARSSVFSKEKAHLSQLPHSAPLSGATSDEYIDEAPLRPRRIISLT